MTTTPNYYVAPVGHASVVHCGRCGQPEHRCQCWETLRPYLVNYYDNVGRAIGHTTHRTEQDARDAARYIIGTNTNQKGYWHARAEILLFDAYWNDTHKPLTDDNGNRIAITDKDTPQ